MGPKSYTRRLETNFDAEYNTIVHNKLKCTRDSEIGIFLWPSGLSDLEKASKSVRLQASLKQ
jgi:hypothetical protein